MLIKKFLMLGTMTALLSSTVFGAGTQHCIGGVCFVNLDNLKPSKTFEQQPKILLTLEKPRFTEETIDKTVTIVLDGEQITVFPSYVMTEEERINYALNKDANKDLEMLTKSVEKIEDKILEKSDLPLSEYYCEKKQKPLYNSTLETFECV